MERKIPEVISEEDLVRIVEMTTDPKYKAAWLWAFYEQLRVSEVANLTPENIETKAHVVHIKQSKGKKDRDITIVKPLKISYNSFIYSRKNFPIGVGIRALQKVFKQKAQDTLNKDLHFHCLRHSGATWLLNKKRWDIRQVQKQLGHSKLSTTEIYTHVNSQDLVDLEWGDDN